MEERRKCHEAGFSLLDDPADRRSWRDLAVTGDRPDVRLPGMDGTLARLFGGKENPVFQDGEAQPEVLSDPIRREIVRDTYCREPGLFLQRCCTQAVQSQEAHRLDGTAVPGGKLPGWTGECFCRSAPSLHHPAQGRRIPHAPAQNRPEGSASGNGPLRLPATRQPRRESGSDRTRKRQPVFSSAGDATKRLSFERQAPPQRDSRKATSGRYRTAALRPSRRELLLLPDQIRERLSGPGSGISSSHR